jgi:hypothetical protein
MAVNASPKVVALDCRAVATRLERLSEEFFQSKEQALLLEAARMLRETADRFDPRERHGD